MGVGGGSGGGSAASDENKGRAMYRAESHAQPFDIEGAGRASRERTPDAASET